MIENILSHFKVCPTYSLSFTFSLSFSIFRWWRWKQKTEVFIKRKTKWSPPSRFTGIPDRFCSIWRGTTWWYQNKDISCSRLEFIVFAYLISNLKGNTTSVFGHLKDQITYSFIDMTILTFNASFICFVDYELFIYSLLWRYTFISLTKISF